MRLAMLSLGALLQALLGCAGQGSAPHPPQGGTEAAARDASPHPLGSVWTGPGFLSGTPYQGLWMGTIGLASTPVFFPWYTAMWAIHGRDVAQRLVYGNPPPDAYWAGRQPLAFAATVPRPSTSLAAIDFGSYTALVIGNADYRSLRSLQTPLNDVEDLASVLVADYAFRVEVLENANRGEILAALARMRRDLGERDNLLIYYAGHGLIDAQTREGYWLPVDATHEDLSTWLSNATISTQLRGIRAKHILLVADSCYAGSLTRGSHWQLGTAAALSRIAEKRARIVLTSGGLEPVADDGGGRNSVFALYFLRALRENQGVLEGSELFGRLRRPVMENARQTPEYGPVPETGHDGGDFLFVRRREVAIPPSGSEREEG